jgi:hypothetical protein
MAHSIAFNLLKAKEPGSVSEVRVPSPYTLTLWSVVALVEVFAQLPELIRQLEIRASSSGSTTRSQVVEANLK